MTYFESLSVELLGGIATGIIIAILVGLLEAARRVADHDRRVAEIQQDTRRWFEDRDRALLAEENRIRQEMGAQGQSYSGALLNSLVSARTAALHEYRDEITSKRREYHAIAGSEGWGARSVRRWSKRRQQLARYELRDRQREVLAMWRGDIDTPGGKATPDDPSREQGEASLVGFESRGDGPFDAPLLGQ